MYIFSERLKDLRIEYGYKQEEIAKALNVTTSAYGYYEQGRNEPSLETVKKIANTFQVSTDYLLGIIDTPNHSVHYSVTEDLSLSESELLAIRKMKELFLEEISKQPEDNVERLQRYWEFIKKEHNI
ncbi:helix-turn-helix transcriptional regulator [Lentibacillus sp. N15]|uniref:helix-turn-helix domain-containing protein n=1 Tax=Lentibacillus songyuanensis TaxID=3136161 RepID=UPI0031B9DA6D